MAKVSINTYKSNGEEGSQEMHYGYLCTVDAEGRLVADVPEDMLQNELDARRVTLIEDEAPAKTRKTKAQE